MLLAILLIFGVALLNIGDVNAENVTTCSTDTTIPTCSTSGTSENQTIISNSSNSTVSSTSTVNKASIDNVHGYWMWASDAYNFNPATLRDSGITDIFLLTKSVSGSTYYQQLQDVIAACNPVNIRVHAWIVCFKDNSHGWTDPADSGYQQYLRDIISNVATNYDVKGIHLDYVRYSGVASNGHAAYQQSPHGTETITNFVASVRTIIDQINTNQGKNLILSAAVMPEGSSNADIYGQDYDRLADYLDFLVPMTYKGNYHAGTSWIGEMTQYIVDHALDKNGNKIPVFAGIQNYRSDDNPELLPQWEIDQDIAEAMSHGAKGYVLFRYDVPKWVTYSVPHPYKKIKYRAKWKVAYKVKRGKGKNKRYVIKYKWKRGWKYKWLYWYETRGKWMLS